VIHLALSAINSIPVSNAMMDLYSKIKFALSVLVMFSSAQNATVQLTNVYNVKKV
jgi:hypothetical protein